MALPHKEAKGAFVSESALHWSMAISRILSADFSNRDDHLSRPAVAGRPRTISAVIDRRYRTHDATIPEDRRTGCPPSVLSCTAWGFSCLANCSASGELLPRLFNLACPSLPKNRRCLFCDTFRHRRFATTTPAPSARHAAEWCSDFPLASLAANQRSSAIIEILPQLGQKKTSGSRDRVMASSRRYRAIRPSYPGRISSPSEKMFFREQ